MMPQLLPRNLRAQAARKVYTHPRWENYYHYTVPTSFLLIFSIFNSCHLLSCDFFLFLLIFVSSVLIPNLFSFFPHHLLSFPLLSDPSRFVRYDFPRNVQDQVSEIFLFNLFLSHYLLIVTFLLSRLFNSFLHNGLIIFS